MSAKFIYSLSDENTDLKRQIGCMNGIFQLFDRRHFLGAGRHIIGKNQKRMPLPPANGKTGIEPQGLPQKNTEKKNKSFREKQRVSTESSRTSSSSSTCSSSVSSLEYSKASQLESSSFSQITVSESRTWGLPFNQAKGSPHSNAQSVDLREAVKDSLHRESRGISIKTATKGEAGGQTLKYIDSPRPSQQGNSLNSKGSGMRESFRVLHKLREVPRQSSEGKNGPLTSALKDARRFSCDGRESRETMKSTIKIKELPRLSLDSKTNSAKAGTTETRRNGLQGELTTTNRNSNNITCQKEPESYRRVSSVVAKLMGLEALPDVMSTSGHHTAQIEFHPDAEKDPLGSSRRTDENRSSPICRSPRYPNKEAISPPVKSVDSVTKPNTSPKIPIEPAPWRQSDGNRGPQAQATKSQATPTRVSNSSLSVYGEIEKRLAQLEFKKSGKDLRALKQILEAMQKTKEILEKRNEVPTDRPHKSSNNLLDQDHKVEYPQGRQNNDAISTTAMGTSSPKSFKSPIIVMKPAKHIGRSSDLISSVNNTDSSAHLHSVQTTILAGGRKESAEKQTTRTRNARNTSDQPLHSTNKTTAAKLTRLAQTSKEPQSTSRGFSNPGKSVGTACLRQSHNKPGLEKNPHLITPSSDSKKTRRQRIGQPKETGSPHRIRRSRSYSLQPSDDDQSDISNDYFSHPGDSISQQSESNISLASQVDEEVSSIDSSVKTNRVFIQQTRYSQKNHSTRSTEEISGAEKNTTPSEQPSPVSVLDSFYNDELPSPIKKVSLTFKDEENQNINEMEWVRMHINHPSSSPQPALKTVINHKGEEDAQISIENLTKMLSAHEDLTADVTPFYSSTSSDHQYIKKVILASGIQKDFESNFTAYHLHPTSYPVNPKLFSALEQANTRFGFANDGTRGTAIGQPEHRAKVQRKLIFDTVNEILVQKFLTEKSSKQWLSQNMMVTKGRIGQQILGKLCSEVDRLQSKTCSLDGEEDSSGSVLWSELMYQEMHWTDSQEEISGLVLDVERLIFKDLINEVITGETISRRQQSAVHCRQQFSK